MISITTLEAADTSYVPFNGQQILTVMAAGVAYVAMRPIVENIGIDWAAQFVKLKKQSKKFGCCDIATPSKGGIQQMLCLPLKKLNGWLFSINPEKVRTDIRDKLIAYQEECFTVLHEYWTKGQVVNPRKSGVAAGKISIEHQISIKNLVQSRGEALPKEKRAKAIITMWSALKTHFGITYKEISDDQYEEAISLIARLPLEGEFLPAAAPMSVSRFPTGKPFSFVTEVDANGSVVLMNVLRDDEFVTSNATHTEMLRRIGTVVIDWEDMSKLTAEGITKLWMDAKAKYLKNTPF